MLAKFEISSFINSHLHHTAQMDRPLKRAYPQQHVVKMPELVSAQLSCLFQAQADTTSIEPGASVSVQFTVTTTSTGAGSSSAAETLSVRATNDRSYTLLSPSSIDVAAGSGGAANGTVNMTVPAGATSGTDVTLTIEVQNAAGTDINYAVLRFLVAAKVLSFILNIKIYIYLSLQ